MSWLFSQALVAEFSAANSLDGEPCAPLNVMPSLRGFWRNDKMMDVLSRSPFGLTWKPLTAEAGAELLTWFQAGFPARTFPAPERAPASTARKADSGGSLPESLAKFDPATSLWKTAQCSLFGGLEEFSATWPRWGMMRDGVCCPLPTPSGLSAFRAVIDQHLTICANESGLSQRMQTPVSDDAKEREKGKISSRGEPKLSAQVMRMPSATVQDGNGRDRQNQRDGSATPTLLGVVRAPSPRASEAAHGGRKLVNHSGQVGLVEFVQRAPTPRSEDSQCAGGHRGSADTLVAFTRLPKVTTSDADGARNRTVKPTKDGVRLSNAVEALTKRAPTTSANDWKGSTKDGQRRGQLTDPAMGILPAGGQLNPQWEDWFMGWPIGWTDARHSGMDKFRQWCASHGICWETNREKTND